MQPNPSGESSGVIMAKLASVWAMTGITNWAEAASALAFLYTFCLLCDLWWKRFWRPLLEEHGWLKRKTRRYGDYQ